VGIVQKHVAGIEGVADLAGQEFVDSRRGEPSFVVFVGRDLRNGQSLCKARLRVDQIIELLIEVPGDQQGDILQIEPGVRDRAFPKLSIITAVPPTMPAISTRPLSRIQIRFGCRPATGLGSARPGEAGFEPDPSSAVCEFVTIDPPCTVKADRLKKP
jgi:hypothetical protein